ncbi:MAG: inorganic phosphate transporter [Candidatus Dormibacteraceae bacterium]
MTAPAIGLMLVGCLYGVVSGFNDGGNLLAVFTAGRVINPRSALLLLLLVPVGAVLVGGAVARTVGAGVIDLRGQGALGFTLITLISVAVVLLSWRARIPTSMTLALVGAMLGWVAVGGAGAGVRWAGAGRVVIGMPVSVLAGGVLALAVYRTVRRLLGRISNALVLGLARSQFLTAALQAFAYGANDLGKAVSLIAVARALPAPGLPITFDGALPIGAAFVSFALGTLFGGWSLARRIGLGVFRLRPMQAASAQLGAGVVVTALALFGAPVSTTQTIDGSLVGVGVGVRASAVRWNLVREMAASWLVTLPAALAAAALIHGALRLVGAG